MNQLQFRVTILLCFLFLGAFVANAGTVMEGENLVVISDLNTIDTPEIWTDLSKETTVKIANQSGVDLKLYVFNVDMTLKGDMTVWIPCHDKTGRFYSELKGIGDSTEKFFVVSECGDTLTIKGKE